LPSRIIELIYKTPGSIRKLRFSNLLIVFGIHFEPPGGPNATRARRESTVLATLQGIGAASGLEGSCGAANRDRGPPVERSLHSSSVIQIVHVARQEAVDKADTISIIRRSSRIRFFDDGADRRGSSR
jgi:hypothetical protein